MRGYGVQWLLWYYCFKRNLCWWLANRKLHLMLRRSKASIVVAPGDKRDICLYESPLLSLSGFGNVTTRPFLQALGTIWVSVFNCFNIVIPSETNNLVDFMFRMIFAPSRTVKCGDVSSAAYLKRLSTLRNSRQWASLWLRIMLRSEIMKSGDLFMEERWTKTGCQATWFIRMGNYG